MSGGSQGIVSIGGAGVTTLGGVVETLDGTGAARNVLDNGAGGVSLVGSLAVAGNFTPTGRIVFKTVAKAVTYAASATDFAIMGTGGAGGITITLNSGTTGQVYVVKKVDAGAGAVTVAASAGNIDGAATQVLAAQNDGIVCQYDGANWWTLAEIDASIL